MSDLLNVLATPVQVFGRLQDRPRWLIAALFCTVTLFLLLWLDGCWQNLSAGLTWSSLLGPALISPLIVGIVSMGSTAFIYLMGMVLRGSADRTTNFRTLLSVNLHCGIIFLLGEVVNFLLVRSNLLGDRGFALPNRFPTGMDLLLLGVDDPNEYLVILLHSTSIFVVWYLIVLALGIRYVTGLSKSGSVFVVIALWCSTVGAALGVVYALGGGTTIRISL
jgi:hypothetical protein